MKTEQEKIEEQSKTTEDSSFVSDKKQGFRLPNINNFHALSNINKLALIVASLIIISLIVFAYLKSANTDMLIDKSEPSTTYYFSEDEKKSILESLNDNTNSDLTNGEKHEDLDLLFDSHEDGSLLREFEKVEILNNLN